MFEIYTEFKQEFNKEPVCNEIYKGKHLGEWVSTQRKNARKGVLSSGRKEQLLEAGFVFDVYGSQWKQMLDLYVEFKQEFGREPKQNETYKGKNLGGWVARQRHIEKTGGCTEEKKEELNNICFSSQGPQNKLKEMIDLYLAFKEEYHREPKHGEIYKGENLGMWLSDQKKNAKRGKMSSERLSLLISSGVLS